MDVTQITIGMETVVSRVPLTVVLLEGQEAIQRHVSVMLIIMETIMDVHNVPLIVYLQLEVLLLVIVPVLPITMEAEPVDVHNVPLIVHLQREVLLILIVPVMLDTMAIILDVHNVLQAAHLQLVHRHAPAHPIPLGTAPLVFVIIIFMEVENQRVQHVLQAAHLHLEVM